jgi:hypothetical protein
MHFGELLRLCMYVYVSVFEKLWRRPSLLFLLLRTICPLYGFFMGFVPPKCNFVLFLSVHELFSFLISGVKQSGEMDTLLKSLGV